MYYAPCLSKTLKINVLMTKESYCLLIKIVFVRVTASEEEPRFPDRACFISLMLPLPVLQEPNEGGNPCTRSNHDNRSAGVVWEVEWIEDSRKDWNLRLKHKNNIEKRA